MDAKQLKAIENIKRAIDVNDSDTLARLSEDGEILWTASGCWTGSRNVTLGDLRAIAAIAPPVAAVSVDKEKIDDLLVALSIAAVDVSRGGHSDIHRDAALELINAIDVWCAQQRHEGFREGVAQLQQERDNLLKLAAIRREWAEKAEAELKQVNEWRSAALAENQALGELWANKLEKAEARVKELESKVGELELDVENLIFQIDYPGEEA